MSHNVTTETKNLLLSGKSCTVVSYMLMTEAYFEYICEL